MIATHAVVNNAPAVVSIMSSAPILAPRVFKGNGPPSSTTLQAAIGPNSGYCGASSGFIVAASIVTGGTLYAAGNVLNVVGGTINVVCQITVDSVDATGKILTSHVTKTGNYSAYPVNAATVTIVAGPITGTGATFNLALQPPDTYFDVSVITAPVEWVCMAGGSNSTSVWQRISGTSSGGGSITIFDPAVSYPLNAQVIVLNTITIASVVIMAGTYACLTALTGPGTGNQLPQYPEPTSGTIYWYLVSFRPQPLSACSGGAPGYINASAPVSI